MAALAKPISSRRAPVGVSSDSVTAPTQWVTIDEAARRTGQSDRHWRRIAGRKCGGAAPLSYMAPPPEGGKPTWWIHQSLLPIASRDQRDDKTRQSLSERFASHLVELAYRKAKYLAMWRDLCRSPRDPGPRRDGCLTDLDLAKQVCEQARIHDADLKISPRTLQLWNAAYNELGDDDQVRGVEALVPRYAFGDRNVESRSAEAAEFFYECYRVQSRPAARVCHELTVREARKQKWQWPAGYSATLRWLREHDNIALTCLFREGKDTWARKYLRHVERDYSGYEPGQEYVTDHHQCDFWVTHENEQIRPWLTAIQDIRTRCIVGWHLGAVPHQDAIIAALRMAFTQWAIPSTLRIDNGKDFASKLITGVTKSERDKLRRELGADWQQILRRDQELVDCADPRFLGIAGELGIEVSYCIPYSPWSKGTLERWFGTFEGQCGKSFMTYCGNAAFNRPECLHEIRRGYTDEQKRRLRKMHGRDWKRLAVLKFVDQSAVPTLDQARADVSEYIDLYHREAHRFDNADIVPLSTWSTATRLRRAVENELLFLMESRGVYKVTANGVSFRVGSKTIGYGATCAAIKPLVGREIFVTLDPQDISCCYAWTDQRQKRKFIARLDSNDRIAAHSTVDEVREVVATVKREQAVMHKAKRVAADRLKTTAQRMTDLRRERVSELRATGTDGHPQPATISVVRTGFEAASKPAEFSPRVPDAYSQVTQKSLYQTAEKDSAPDAYSAAARSLRCVNADELHELTDEDPYASRILPQPG